MFHSTYIPAQWAIGDLVTLEPNVKVHRMADGAIFSWTAVGGRKIGLVLTAKDAVHYEWYCEWPSWWKTAAKFNGTAAKTITKNGTQYFLRTLEPPVIGFKLLVDDEIIFHPIYKIHV